MHGECYGGVGGADAGEGFSQATLGQVGPALGVRVKDIRLLSEKSMASNSKAEAHWVMEWLEALGLWLNI